MCIARQRHTVNFIYELLLSIYHIHITDWHSRTGNHQRKLEHTENLINVDHQNQSHCMTKWIQQTQWKVYNANDEIRSFRTSEWMCKRETETSNQEENNVIRICEKDESKIWTSDKNDSKHESKDKRESTQAHVTGKYFDEKCFGRSIDVFMIMIMFKSISRWGTKLYPQWTYHMLESAITLTRDSCKS